MFDVGRQLVFFGLVLVTFGVFLSFFDNTPFGRLPGDFLFRKGNFTFYAPVATSLIVSILLTIVLNLINRR
jgi:hypothetical protein